jgi:YbbR domain-containing protein
VLLWALVSAEQVTMHWIPVTVEADVRDPGYVLTGGPGPHEVRVLFAGPGRLLWQLALNRPTLILPVRDEERTGYALDADMIRLPEGVRGVAVREIRPAVVRVEVQRLATREVPVRVRFTRRSLAGFVIRGLPDVSPATVRVTGPRDDLARLAEIETRPFTVSSEDSTEFEGRVALDTTGLPDFTVSPRTVRVRGELDRRAERTVRDVPVASANGTATGVADLRLSGPMRVLGELEPGRIRIEDLPTGLRMRGIPASVQATVIARRAAPAADSAHPPAAP